MALMNPEPMLYKKDLCTVNTKKLSQSALLSGKKESMDNSNDRPLPTNSGITAGITFLYFSDLPPVIYLILILYIYS